MRLLIAVVAALVAAAAPACAQQSRATIESYVNGKFWPNGVGAITGDTLKNGLLGVIEGAGILSDTNAWTGTNTFTGPFSATIAGTGATLSMTLADRATNRGVTFNLKTDFGAVGDNVADDTVAIQNWLNKAGTNVDLVAPPGNYKFTDSLVASHAGTALLVPSASKFSIHGAGHGATVFVYAGTTTNIDLFTVTTLNVNDCSGTNLVLSGFRVASNTAMTLGDGIRFNSLCQTTITDVFGGSPLNGNSNLYIGCHIYGGNNIYVVNYGCRGSYSDEVDNGFSSTNAAIDIYHYNSALAGSGGTYALLIAGNCGGCYWDSADVQTAPLGANVRIDQSVIAAPNNQIRFGANFATDGGGSVLGIDLQDSGQPAGYPFALTATGSWTTGNNTINVNACPASSVNKSLFDMTSVPPVQVGTLSTCSGGVLTLTGNAAFASVGMADNLTVIHGPGVGKTGKELFIEGSWVSTTETCMNIAANTVWEIHLNSMRMENCATAGIVVASPFDRILINGGAIGQTGTGIVSNTPGTHIELQSRPSVWGNAHWNGGTGWGANANWPTIVSGCGGTGAQVYGDDYDWRVAWGSTSGTSCVLAFGFQHDNSPTTYQITPAVDNTAYVTATTSTGITVNFHSAMTSGQQFSGHLSGWGF